MGFMKNKAILKTEVKSNREIEIILQKFKDNQLTATEEDFMIESQLEQIREQRERERGED